MTTTRPVDGPAGTIYEFSPHQRVFRDPETSELLTEHADTTKKGFGKTRFLKGPGPNGWPIFNFEGVSTYLEELRSLGDPDPDFRCVYEFPDLIDAQAAVEIRQQNAFCQPHHAQSHQEMVLRYQDLRYRGAWCCYYITPDRPDEEEKALRHQKAAMEGGLLLLIVKSHQEPLFVVKADKCRWLGVDQNPFFRGQIGRIYPRDRGRYMTELYHLCDYSLLSDPEFQQASLLDDDDRETLLLRGASHPEQTDEYWLRKRWAEPTVAYWNTERLLQRGNFLTEALSTQIRANHSGPSKWDIFTGTHWQEQNTHDVVNALQEEFYVRNEWSSRDLRDLSSDRSQLRRGVASAIPKPSRRLLPFLNTCLDLDSRECIKHSPNNGNRFVLRLNYEPGDREPKKIKAFLLDRLGDPELVEMYRAFVWHCLTGRSLKAFLEITGPAHTGKTVLTNLIIAIVGVINTVSCDLSQLEDSKSRFESHRLSGKKLAVFSESQDYKGTGEMLKALTGRDRIRAEKKNSSEDCDFTYGGVVVLTGNSSVNFKDASAAINNRRRSLFVEKVIDFKDERVMCEDDGEGNWRGELVPELSTMVNWVLDMDPADAIRAMSRNLISETRRNAAKQSLLDSNPLAAWANERLVYDSMLKSDGKPLHAQGVGNLKSDPQTHLLTNYRSWLEANETGEALTTKTFKRALVEMLQGIGIPLPPGPLDKGQYRIDGKGSVVPFLRFRRADDAADHPGVIDAAFNVQTVRERFANAKTPVANGSNGSNGSEEVSAHRGSELFQNTHQVGGTYAWDQESDFSPDTGDGEGG
ncbi:DUF5906 domain-containing protein [Synechococcus sp. A15-28]|uniref:DUF5906 domain-containing protein n=1 Tax=Synechococcus sp. A15-28 TaxID=1050638 RepID=UPI0016454241|nr:DUF5906 domain-containing protein [Synechococcus sp. A15-28]QNI42982.1 hypothetical protein SynA1528_01960 [Synechococcus sp. A15-28]